MYYLRTRPAVDPIKFTVDSAKLAASAPAPAPQPVSVHSSPKKKTNAAPAAPLAAAVVPKLTEEELEAMRDYEARLNACSIENKDVGFSFVVRTLDGPCIVANLEPHNYPQFLTGLHDVLRLKNLDLLVALFNTPSATIIPPRFITL